MIFKIGSHVIQPGLVLAPMAGTTNHPFRLLAKEQGCRLLYSEMISAKGLLSNEKRAQHLLYFTEEERPLGFQLFGSEPEIMARAAQKLEELGVDFIDLNLGCPARKIIRQGEGGALMREPKRCSAIFRAVVRSVSCPVTVKIRRGWDENSVNAQDIATRAEEAGIQAVAVHGRTVVQGYSGKADWEIIRLVKETLAAIPVIGNGDVDSPQSAEAMLNYCGCDGVMIGRAVRGNPWLFKAVLSHLLGSPPPEKPAATEIVNMALRHFKLLIALKGENVATREMRRHTAWYIRGFIGSAATRQQLLQAKNFTETEAILRDFCRSSSVS